MIDTDGDTVFEFVTYDLNGDGIFTAGSSDGAIASNPWSSQPPNITATGILMNQNAGHDQRTQEYVWDTDTNNSGFVGD